MFNISNISLGTSARKRYTRSLNHDCNTTMPFGFVQPILTQRLEADSDIVVSSRQLVRLAPLPVPTFGRMKLVNKASYVPISDVCPYYEALLKEQPFKGSQSSFVPTKLPTITNANLAYLLLLQSRYSLYRFNGPVGSNNQAALSLMDAAPDTFDSAFLNHVFANIGHHYGYSVLQSKFFIGAPASAISPDGADYVVVFNDGSIKYLAAFRFTRTARNLRSIFIGLGYSCDIADYTPLSIVPLLSYYKSWFDTFAPQRSLAWINSNCYGVIQAIGDLYFNDFSGATTFPASVEQSFSSFISDLETCFYVSNDDFVSVHRSKPILQGSQTSYVDTYGEKNIYSLSNPNVDTNINPSINLQLLQTVQRLTKFVNKDSIIGKKLSDWVKVHFNADIANSLYKDVYQISSWNLPLSVDDIFSTSDTAVTTEDSSHGELLGAYAGKGIGYSDNGKFKFHAPYAGYLFILSCVVPESGYYQGSSADLLAIDRDTIPFPEFDALGYELNPRSLFMDGNSCDISNIHTGSKATDDITNAFGFVPRYSALKVKRNTVNGDMSRRGTVSSLSPYYLDRIITRHDVRTFNKITNPSGTTMSVEFLDASVPSATEQWRYLCRYPWLGNFDRIFYNSGSLYNQPTNANISPFNTDILLDIDDNFIVQTVFDVKVTDFLKPLALSWDTFDEDKDTSTVDVAAE